MAEHKRHMDVPPGALFRTPGPPAPTSALRG